MSKNIVFCADGTWNGPGRSLDGDTVPSLPTNVLKLYQWLAGLDTGESAHYAGEAERFDIGPGGELRQISKYMDGVGDSKNWLNKFLGGVFGAGMVSRIVRGYTFISRNYVAGDRIFLLGFSRGAYTARALAAMILDQGLLDAKKTDFGGADNANQIATEAAKEEAYRLGCAVWYKYIKGLSQRNGATFIQKLEETIAVLPGFFREAPDASKMIVNVDIQAVAAWDTVGALGIPQYDSEDRRIDVFRFADCCLNKRVEYGFHALSLDEQRTDLTPTLWEARNNVTQLLFPGAHADIGGGYPLGIESGLSDDALLVMRNELSKLPDGKALLFGLPPDQVSPDPLGCGHQPWNHWPYRELPRSHIKARVFPDFHGIYVDHSVTERRAGGMVKSDPLEVAEEYLPKNIPTR